jgi:CHAD domain-containing protein
MKIAPDKALKPLRQLSRSLEELTPEATVDEIHDLRTQTRRVQAVVQALGLGREKAVRELLKQVKPLRKAACGARDMDVQTLPLLDGAEALAAHLASLRETHAKTFAEAAARGRKKARSGLKECAKLVSKRLDAGSETPLDSHWAPAHLAQEMARWPEFTAANLHDFRIAVKALHYMLQLSDQAEAALLTALGGAKDAIGDWHDWEELQRIAAAALAGESAGELRAALGAKVAETLAEALRAARELRRKYLATPAQRRRRANRTTARKSAAKAAPSPSK